MLLTPFSNIVFVEGNLEIFNEFIKAILALERYHQAINLRNNNEFNNVLFHNYNALIYGVNMKKD